MRGTSTPGTSTPGTSTPGTSTPVARHRIATSDPEEALALQQGFTRFRARPIDREGFTFGLEWASIESFDVSHMRHGPRIDARSEPPARLTVAEVIDGGMSIADRYEHHAADVLLTPHWSPYDAAWAGRTRITTLDQAEVARVGAEVSGGDTSEIRFGSMLPQSPALARYWATMVHHVDRNVLAHDDLMSSALVRGEIPRQLARAVLAVFANSALDRRHEGRRERAEPATVRRAVDFMDAHAHEDIDVVRIAEAAHIGVRGLQSAFRRHRDQTPLEYLRRVRLERAHRDLQAADPTRGDTVAAIAAHWGFAHPGRFSIDYRREFGRPPGRTLRA